MNKKNKKKHLIQGKNHSEEYGTHNLSFQAMYKYFKKIGNNGISS